MVGGDRMAPWTPGAGEIPPHSSTQPEPGRGDGPADAQERNMVCLKIH